MVKQTNQTIVSQIDKLNEKETLAVVGYISQLLSGRISKTKENYSNDDLIMSLSNAYENQRARQVFEWEKIRRQNAQRAA
jgi:putative NIF3 family GTP cyclohydrolase 1 type 2